jgi:hypothetical protein
MKTSPTAKQLASIKRFAHRAFGHILLPSQIVDVWLISQGLTPVHSSAWWQVPHVMRDIANCWACCMPGLDVTITSETLPTDQSPVHATTVQVKEKPIEAISHGQLGLSGAGRAI